MKKQFTVQCGFPAYYGNTVTVEAETLDEALEKAIEAANDDPNWKSLDHCGPTHVDACCIGGDEDPGTTTSPCLSRPGSPSAASRRW